MRRLLILAGVGGLLLIGFARAAPLRRGKEIAYLDLQPKANIKLKEALQGGRPGNDLADLPRGEQKFGGVKFKIGDGLIQLEGPAQTFPTKVDGIKVGRKFAKLYILHAAGRCLAVKDGAVIANYTVHYKDKTKTTIEIVYGKDVRDWWELSDSRKVTRAKVAWEGDNRVRKDTKTKMRLYLTTWENPHPKKEVARIDYVCTRGTPAWPFCVAMTVEGK
jgi:hypothetical protein